MPSQLEVDSSVSLISQINGLFNRCFKYGYYLKVNTVEDLIESANYKLFKKFTKSTALPPALLPSI